MIGFHFFHQFDTYVFISAQTNTLVPLRRGKKKKKDWNVFLTVTRGTVWETGVPVTILLHLLPAATASSAPAVPCEPPASQRRPCSFFFNLLFESSTKCMCAKPSFRTVPSLRCFLRSKQKKVCFVIGWVFSLIGPNLLRTPVRFSQISLTVTLKG